MKKILIIHAHTANRGDEAAVKAMVDEILTEYPDAKITISINGDTYYPLMDPRVKQIGRFPKPHSIIGKIEYPLFIKSTGMLSFTSASKNFKEAVQEADLVIHAPGGPSIGDTYLKAEKSYLDRIEFINYHKKPYIFYAPSMGPFNNQERNIRRKRVLCGAKAVILRDPISYNYVKELCPECHPILTLDSAFQHDVDIPLNEKKLMQYNELNEFLKNNPICVGITITDLKWHPVFGNSGIDRKIISAFNEFIQLLSKQKYGIIFIPQLYGSSDDYSLMKQFAVNENCFVVDANSDVYETYFQQYIISRLFAVVGMRYHSNIFSAKMGTPFVSISYEQKMKGFVDAIGVAQYCIPVEEISCSELKTKFELLKCHHDEYSSFLKEKHKMMKDKSFKSTKIVLDILKKY